MWRHTDPVDAQALRSGPQRTYVPQQVITPPQAATGFVWAMGEGGDFYRFNPYAAAGEQLEIQDRLWAEPQPHAFCLGQLQLPGSAGGSGRTELPAELCALVATHERVLVTGLFSRRRRTFLPMANENWLVNSRDAYQFVVALGSAIYLLSRYAGQIAFCESDVPTGETRRFSIGYGDMPICGPVLFHDRESGHIVLWTSRSLWVYTKGDLRPVSLPEGFELWTAPVDAGLGISPGRSPAIAGPGHLYLPGRHFGRPALLLLARGPSDWSTTAIAILDEGTLGESTDGYALLSTPNKLLRCTGTTFRPLVHDPQIAVRSPAWSHQDLALYFCQADYGGLKQWLKGDQAGSPVPVAWDLPLGAEVHACQGFWTAGTTLSSICVVGDRGLRTEFLSWCV